MKTPEERAEAFHQELLARDPYAINIPDIYLAGRNAGIEEAVRTVAEERCERGTPYDLALRKSIKAIRALKTEDKP